MRPDDRTDRVRGRVDAVLVANRVAPTTRAIGVIPAAITTHTEPFHTAKAIATLDYVAHGRAGVQLRVDGSVADARLFGRRTLPHLVPGDPDPVILDALFTEAADYAEVLRRLWDSWEDGAEIRDAATGCFIDRDKLHYIDFEGEYFRVRGPSITPRPPQGQPPIAALGHNSSAYDLIGRVADLGFITAPDATAAAATVGEIDAARVSAGRADPRYGRRREQLLILPAATFVLGDTDSEAADLAHEVRLAQVSGATALRFLEQVWNRDLSDVDPDDPLPQFDPVVGEHTIARGRASVRSYRDPLQTAREWRERAEANNWSIRELIIEVTGRQAFVGSAQTIAERLDDSVQNDVSDGFILVPHITPGGLDRFVDEVVPILQERGSFRADYTDTTLRDHLGIDRVAQGSGRAAS